MDLKTLEELKQTTQFFSDHSTTTMLYKMICRKIDELSALEEKTTSEPDKTLGLFGFSGSFPTSKEMNAECEEYAKAIQNETDYKESSMHLKYAFKAGFNYLADKLNCQ